VRYVVTLKEVIEQFERIGKDDTALLFSVLHARPLPVNRGTPCGSTLNTFIFNLFTITIKMCTHETFNRKVYFSILRDYFEPIAKLENKHKYPRDQTMQVLPQIYDISTLKSTLNCLYGDLSKLDWTSQEQSLKDMTGVRTSYVGIDIQGTKEEALGYLKRICLYSDIIIMNDPLLSELRAWKMRKERGYVPSFMYVTDSALNL